MKAVLLSLCAAAGLALSAAPARADYPYGYRYYSRPYYGSYSRPWPGYSYYRPYYGGGWYAPPDYGYTYAYPYGSYYSPYYYYGPRYSFGYAGPNVAFWIGR
jgi:hypothetical protein